VRASGADEQGPWSDISQCRRTARSQLIVAGGGAAERQAGGGDSLGCACRFAGEACSAAAQAHVVAGQRAAQYTRGDTSRGGAVINLVVGGDAARKDSFGHIKGAA